MGEDSSTKQLYDLIRDLSSKVAALTAILERVEGDRKEDRERIHDLELESAKRKGIMAVVGAIGGVVGTVAVWIIKHFWGGS